MRKLLLFIIVLISGIIIISRLLYLQVFNPDLKVISENNAISVLYDYPERGYIFDRNGELLVANQPSYDVMVIPKDIKNLDTLEFCRLLDITQERLETLLSRAKIYSPRLPSVILPQLTEAEFAFVQEKMYK